MSIENLLISQNMAFIDKTYEVLIFETNILGTKSDSVLLVSIYITQNSILAASRKALRF